jgi:hypothetical protein
VANSIELILDDAEAVVPQLDAFDFIFLDVDKRLYPPLLPECVRLLREKVSSQPGIPYSPSSTSTQSGMISSRPWMRCYLLSYAGGRPVGFPLGIRDPR